MLRKLAAVALCAASLVSASDKAVAAKHLLASSQRYNVTHDDKNDLIKVNGIPVKYEDLDASLRKPGSIRELFKSNRSKLEVSRVGNDYAIKRHEQLKGGGLIAGSIAYWATKTLCYGTAVAATGAVVVGTGGAAGAVTSVMAAAATGGATTAATLTGTAIAGAGLSAQAATATVAVVQATGGMTAIGSTVAAVETAAATAGWFFTCIPWLP